MKVTVRYDVKRDYGGKEPETRRQYNARFHQPTGPIAEIPAHGRHLWEWFWELSGQRWYTDGSPLPLGYPAIRAWSKLTDNRLLPVELQAITQMDDAYLRECGEESRASLERSEERAKARSKRR